MQKLALLLLLLLLLSLDVTRMATRREEKLRGARPDRVGLPMRARRRRDKRRNRSDLFRSGLPVDRERVRDGSANRIRPGISAERERLELLSVLLVDVVRDPAGLQAECAVWGRAKLVLGSVGECGRILPNVRIPGVRGIVKEIAG